MKQASDVHKAHTQKHYRTTQTAARIMVFSIVILGVMFITLAFKVHILAAFLVVIPFFIIMLATYSFAIIDVTCGEEYLEIRRLKVFPPLKIAWNDIRDVKWHEGKEILIYLRNDPHPVHVETVRFAKLDGSGLLKTTRERAGLRLEGECRSRELQRN